MNKKFKQVNATGTYWYADRECTILHRTDGPAIEWNNGEKTWYRHGKQHRLDGAAIERFAGSKTRMPNPDGSTSNEPAAFKFWFVDGKQVTEEEHKQLAAKIPVKVLAFDYTQYPDDSHFYTIPEWSEAELFNLYKSITGTKISEFDDPAVMCATLPIM